MTVDLDDYTLNSIETVITSDGDDTISGLSGVDTIDAGNGDDVINVASGDSIVTLNAGADTSGDTLSYLGFGSSVTLDLINDTGTGITNINGVENFSLSNSDDTIDFDTSDTFNVDGNGGTGDHVNLSGTIGVGQEAASFASLFTDIEEFDFTNVTLSDSFDIGDDDIANIMGVDNSEFRIFISDSGSIGFGDFSVLNQSGSVSSDITSGAGVGSTRTVDWNDGTRLVVETVA